MVKKSTQNMPARDVLDRSIDCLRGIGPKKKQNYAFIGIHTIRDVLFYYPRQHETIYAVRCIADLKDNVVASFVAHVEDMPTLRYQGRRSTLHVQLADDSKRFQALFFNQPYVMSKIDVGASYLFTGRIKRDERSFCVINPTIEEKDKALHEDRLLPVYPLTEGISQNDMRRLTRYALDVGLKDLIDPFDASCREAYGLIERRQAIAAMHYPAMPQDLVKAKKSLAFEELLLLQLGLRWAKNKRQTGQQATAILLSMKQKQDLNSAILALPYTLTSDQTKACDDILIDLAKTMPMSRMVQGDVGCGKTVVAAVAALACGLSGKQCAVLVPTTILAKQHIGFFESFFRPFDVKVACMTGTMAEGERRSLWEKMKKNEIQVVIGTHALLSKRDAFSDLALVITDEQHRFGVLQRASLSSGQASYPHVLVMSATPIPRTLAMICLADLNLTIIREKPVGRKMTKTYLATDDRDDQIVDLIARYAKDGQQVYVVCPTICTACDETMPHDVEGRYRYYLEKLPKLNVAKLHGAMAGEQMAETMRAFYDRKIDILVTTTVIEVGIDHDNANLMIVEAADRFGLAQLHQLRGRVGRGANPGLCIVKTSSEAPDVLTRLTLFCRINDGLKLATKDLALRGPGDFFGTQQHGKLLLKAANIGSDQALIEATLHAAKQRLKNDPMCRLPDSQLMLTCFIRDYAPIGRDK